MSKTTEQIQAELQAYIDSKTQQDLKRSDDKIIGNAKTSRALTGREVPWLEGKKRPEHSKKIKGLLVGELNPMFGKQAWNKGLDKSDPRVLKYSKSEGKAHPGNQYGKGNIGKVQDEEWKRKRLDKIKGPHELTTCPYCSKKGGERIMKRWHFDNCKLKA
jgi:hypothetical protein